MTMNISGTGVSMKRLRHGQYQDLNHASSPPITMANHYQQHYQQHDGNYQFKCEGKEQKEIVMDIEMPNSKRQRLLNAEDAFIQDINSNHYQYHQSQYRQRIPISPGVVSIASTCAADNGMNISTTNHSLGAVATQKTLKFQGPAENCADTNTSRDTTTSKKEWWKQNIRDNTDHSHTKSGSIGFNPPFPSCCFVCQKSFTNSSRTDTQHDVILMNDSNDNVTRPSNSLLAYFPIQKSNNSNNNNRKGNCNGISKTTTARHTTTGNNHDTSCSFCERFICTDCVGACENCLLSFCLFCYGGHLDNKYCLDCIRYNSNHESENDPMALD